MSTGESWTTINGDVSRPRDGESVANLAEKMVRTRTGTDLHAV